MAEPLLAGPALPAVRLYRPDPRHPDRLIPSGPSEDEPSADLTAAAIHGAFRSFVLDPHYPCLGSKSAVNNGSYRLGIYSELGSPEASDSLAADLISFVADPETAALPFATFVAVFEGNTSFDPEAFEERLWRQLQQLHDRDDVSWDHAVSSNPADRHFSFSFGGMAFFVVGLHPRSERLSRRFPWPTLVLNPHDQFERLRNDQKYGRMQEVIRERERELQGDINPVLRDYGDDSEARQYSGRGVEPDWQAPFEPRGEDPS